MKPIFIFVPKCSHSVLTFIKVEHLLRVYLWKTAVAPSDWRPEISEQRGEKQYQIQPEIAGLCRIITMLTQMILSDLCKHQGAGPARPA